MRIGPFECDDLRQAAALVIETDGKFVAHAMGSG
jgi:hypothetical protein